MQTKFLLTDSQIPKAWYNVVADMSNPPAPVIHPGTGAPVGPQDLAPLFPMSLIEQEVSTQRFIPIPEECLELFRLHRPSPLFRAHRLEKAIGTRSRIFYKYEGNNSSGSHKLNTAIPQAFFNKQAGRTRIATETGAGQWGSALALSCKLFEMECTVYMVKVSYEQKPYRKALIQTYGAEVSASPSTETESGRAILAQDPDSPGSLGIAISEAVEVAVKTPHTKYALGSVLNHVMLHQTIIGLEAEKQFKIAGDWPDIVIGCVGGGSNFAGISFPFLRHRLQGGEEEKRWQRKGPPHVGQDECPHCLPGIRQES